MRNLWHFYRSISYFTLKIKGNLYLTLWELIPYILGTVYIYIYITWVCMCVCAWGYVSVYVSLCVCMYVCMSVGGYVSMFMSMCVYACMYMCVYVHVCVPCTALLLLKPSFVLWGMQKSHSVVCCRVGQSIQLNMLNTLEDVLENTVVFCTDGTFFYHIDWNKVLAELWEMTRQTAPSVFHYDLLWWPLNGHTGVSCRALQPHGVLIKWVRHFILTLTVRKAP